MKSKLIFEGCRNLVFKYGHVEGDGFESMIEGTFEDPCDCDFKINYEQGSMRKNGRQYENMRVYFGGREVYNYNSWNPEALRFVNGSWCDLIPALGRYYSYPEPQKLTMEESASMEICRREARANRKIMEGYLNMACAIVRKKGQADACRNLIAYYYELKKEWCSLKIEVREEIYSQDYGFNYVIITFNEMLVFEFRWAGSKGGYWDNRGIYRSGDWEEIVEEIYNDLQQ